MAETETFFETLCRRVGFLYDWLVDSLDLFLQLFKTSPELAYFAY